MPSGFDLVLGPPNSGGVGRFRYGKQLKPHSDTDQNSRWEKTVLQLSC
jgi:hypothetical protein